MLENSKAFSGFSVDDLVVRGVRFERYENSGQDEKGINRAGSSSISLIAA